MRKATGVAVLLLLFLLTACKAGEETDDAPEEEIVYRSEFVSLHLDSDFVVDACRSGDFLYILDEQINFSDGASDPGTLRQLSLDGSQNWALAVDEIAGGYGYINPRSLQEGPDGALWMRLERSLPPGSEEVAEDPLPLGTLLYEISPEGEVLSVQELGPLSLDSGQDAQKLWVSATDRVWLADDGWVYVHSDGVVYVFDSQRMLQFSLDPGVSPIDGPAFVRLSSGDIGCLVYEAAAPGREASYQVRAIDRTAQTWGEAYPLPGYASYIYPGSGGYLFFANSSGTIWGWDQTENTPKVVTDSTAAGTDLSADRLKYFALEPDGVIRMVTHSFYARGGELTVMTPVDPDSLPEPATLTLACLACSSPLRSYVNNFNRSHPDCRIELVEYSSDPHMPLEGYERMVVDITAGNVPDILCLDRLPAGRFCAKGLFEDLWPYIENDPELGRDALMTHVLECAEQDGRLYYIFDSFQMKTAAAPAGVVGDRLGWTLEDLRAALEEMPEGCLPYSPAESKQDLLWELLSGDMDRYVDWEAGTCTFDSEQFKDLLAYINSLDISPDSRDYEIEHMESTILDGRQMLYYDPSGSLVDNFYAVQRCEAVLGGPVSFCGYPTQDGSCGSAFYIGYDNCPLAMTGACRDKEAAWSFLRELLLPQDVDCSTGALLSSYRFPINWEDFDRLARAYRESEDVIRMGFDNIDGETVLTVEYAAVSAEEYDQIMELYNAIGSIYSTDEDIWEIVGGEAAAYFAGERTLEDAAARIQNRAQLYVDEQR